MDIMRHRFFSILVMISIGFVPLIRAQDNPMDDPDLQQLLKQAQEMQKSARDLQKNPGSKDAQKNLADLEAMAKEQAAQQEQDEKREKDELQTALKKQLDAPGPVAFPDWMPVTPFGPAPSADTRPAMPGASQAPKSMSRATFSCAS